MAHQHRTRHGKQQSQAPPPPPSYLRILFPRNIQQREPVPQLLNHPHPDLDAEAYHFLAFLVRDFIQTWYTSFSSDPQFVATIVNVVIHIARELERRSLEIDWVGLMLQDVPEVLRRHYTDYRQAAQKLDTAYAPNQTIESIFHGLQPHFALRDGEESEKEYLRQLADELLKILLPESEYHSDCVRWLVREILACLVLRSVVEILTEPDMINYIVNTLLVDFGPTEEEYEVKLQKAAEEIAKSNNYHSKFLSALRPRSTVRGKLVHRSSTPNIKPTDDMVDMLQEAQASALETPQHPSEQPRGLSKPERNDKLLSHRITGEQNSQTSRRVPESANHIPRTDIPSVLAPSSNNKNRIAQAEKSTFDHNSVGPNNGKPTPLSATQTHPQGAAEVVEQIRSNAVWAVTVAPKDFIINILIPFWAAMIVLTNFLLTLPKKVTQTSQSIAWIYAELDAPEHTDLETGIFKLVKEIFYLEERNQVVWRQWEIMGWPLIRTLGGGAIDRLLAHGVYWIFAEPRLVTYIQAGRRALWPGPDASPPRPRGVHEMEKARKEAEKRILRTIPAPLRDLFFGDDGMHHLAAAQEALEPFQNKICNKHLMYIALDLLLSKVVPEIYLATHP
ncbi:hypothetical protein MVEG_06563 [Podila verticillata NRRL 6337]|nr:hypothetical protein MVEG_06563 [Podila verticillata NRRL 6337]